MGTLRGIFGDHRALTVLLLALALAMKALVPAGYMPGSGVKILSISICADASGGQVVKQISIPQSGKPGESRGEHGKAGTACSFASLAMASLAGADAPLLALLLAFVLAIGLLPSAPPPASRAPRLRPPLRGPPAHI